MNYIDLKFSFLFFFFCLVFGDVLPSSVLGGGAEVALWVGRVSFLVALQRACDAENQT